MALCSTVFVKWPDPESNPDIATENLLLGVYECLYSTIVRVFFSKTLLVSWRLLISLFFLKLVLKYGIITSVDLLQQLHLRFFLFSVTTIFRFLCLSVCSHITVTAWKVFIIFLMGECHIKFWHTSAFFVCNKTMYLVHRWGSWLRHWAISWKVAGLIPDGVFGVFHRHNPLDHHCTLVDSSSTRNEYQEYFLVIKAAGM